MKNKNWGTLVITLMIVLSLNFVLADNETIKKTVSATPNISIEIIESAIELGEDVNFAFFINSQEKIVPLKIDYGDDSVNALNIHPDRLYIQKHEYSKSGNYRITITINTTDGQTFSEESETIKVKETELPDENPEIELISPQNNLFSKQDQITFKFKASDDRKLSSCLFELFQKQNGFETLEYQQEYESPENNKEITVELKEFDDGNYTWYITCEDNKSQSDSKNRDLEIKTVSHEREKEILAVIDNIDAFLEKQDDFGLEKKEALEELEIPEKLKNYKDRLKQINQDLGYNIKFISGETMREKRKIELYEELDDIEKKIPNNIKIIDTAEYIKNSLTIPLGRVMTDYVNTENIDINKRQLKNFIKTNTDLQEKLITSVGIKQVEISYNGSSDIITLIKKKLKITDTTINKTIEIIPNFTMEDIAFQVPIKKINNNIFEIEIKDLKENEIIYQIKGKIDINKLKNSETLLLNEKFTRNNGITGYFLFMPDFQESKNYIVSVLALILLLFFTIKLIKNIKIKNWKKEENVEKTFRYIKRGTIEISKDNIEIAKENYHKIKTIFNLLPEDFKNYSYNKIKNLRIEIDKKEIRNFIREYEKAKKEKRKDDEKLLYKKIKDKYKNLPKKYQEKVYKRII